MADNTSFHILHIDNNIGETTAAYNEHSLSKAEEYHVSVCCFFPSPVNVPDSIKFYEGGGTLRSFYRCLRQSLRATEYDVIHVHNTHVGILTILYLLLHPHLFSRTVYTVHNSFQNYSWKYKALLTIPFGFYRKVVHCSWSSYHSFPLFYRVLGGKRRTAVSNGVDVERVTSALRQVVDAPAVSTTSSIRKISSIGRLVPIKNLYTLIEATLALEDDEVVLDIFGQGILYDELKAKIEQKGARDVVALRGVVPREQVYHEIASSDIFISTSFGEGLPIAVLEAMCCGCPVILSDIPPHRELADACDFLPLVSPRDTAGFTAELRRLLALSAEQRRQLGNKSRDLVSEHFSLESMHKGYATVYAQK